MKTTRWFLGSLNPVRVGVYETTEPVDKYDYFSWWDGLRWNGQWSSVENAASNSGYGEGTEVKQWRGLKREPK